MLAWLSVWSEVQTCILAQLMPLPLTVSCFSKIQIGFTFLIPAHPGSPGKRAVKRARVCVCVHVCIIFGRFSFPIATMAPLLMELRPPADWNTVDPRTSARQLPPTRPSPARVCCRRANVKDRRITSGGRAASVRICCCCCCCCDDDTVVATAAVRCTER